MIHLFLNYESLQQDWRLAASYAERLCNESFWSKTVYMYQQASMLAMLGKDLKIDDLYLIEQLIQYVFCFNAK